MRGHCRWCRGAGKNRAPYGPVPCPDCDGTWREPEKEELCPACGDVLLQDGECETCEGMKE